MKNTKSDKKKKSERAKEKKLKNIKKSIDNKVKRCYIN